MLYYRSILAEKLFTNHSELYQNFIKNYPIPDCLLSPISHYDFLKNRDVHLSYLKSWIMALNAHIHTIINNTQLDDLCQENSILPTVLTFRTAIMDSILMTLFNHINLTHTALFAIGGYARAELFSHSDIDLLILYDNQNLDDLETFVAMLWDMGISPAVRIRHISDDKCVMDSTIATSLLENRFLTGEAGFMSIPQNWLKLHYTPITFFTAKYQEYKTRHQKNDYNEYVLEPNVKESVGGLRDIHFLHWIAKFYFNLAPDITLRQLVQSQFLTDKECDELICAKHFLWVIRHYLHTNDEKDLNLLSFGQQKQIATQLGFVNKDNNPNYAPESLMKRYYRSAMTIATLGNYLGELFFNEFLQTPTTTPLTPYYYVSQSYFGEQLGVYDNELFLKNPNEILTAFLLMGEKDIKSLTANTLRALRNASMIIDEDFLNNDLNKQLFLKNLDEPNYLFHRLRLMKRTDILGKYLPDFHNITGLMQYDLFHSYTVDAHTLMFIRILHRFYRDDFGLLSTVYKELDNRFILVVAGIFHDIAKGKNGDHSILGAKIVKEFCQTHHINQKDSELIEWLVRHHLDMSMTAQKKDIYDPVVINEFADFVGDIRHLDYLYVLTVADMNATNRQLWNNWRASLLKQLYLSTHKVLTLGSQKTSDLINKKRQKLIGEFGKNYSENLPDDYLLRHSFKTLLWHGNAITKHNKNTPLILLRPYYDKTLQAYELFIYTANCEKLFATTVMSLDNFGIGVYGASILTSKDNYALDTFIITAYHRHNGCILDNDDWQNLKKTLMENLSNPTLFFNQNCHLQKQRLEPQALKHFHVKPHIALKKLNATQYYLEIHSKDRPSLLAKIGQVLGAFDISVHTANITTLGERVEDSFVIDGEGLTVNKSQLFIDDLYKTLAD